MMNVKGIFYFPLTLDFLSFYFSNSGLLKMINKYGCFPNLKYENPRTTLFFGLFTKNYNHSYISNPKRKNFKKKLEVG